MSICFVFVCVRFLDSVLLVDLASFLSAKDMILGRWHDLREPNHNPPALRPPQKARFTLNPTQHRLQCDTRASSESKRKRYQRQRPTRDQTLSHRFHAAATTRLRLYVIAQSSAPVAHRWQAKLFRSQTAQRSVARPGGNPFHVALMGDLNQRVDLRARESKRPSRF